MHHATCIMQPAIYSCPASQLGNFDSRKREEVSELAIPLPQFAVRQPLCLSVVQWPRQSSQRCLQQSDLAVAAQAAQPASRRSPFPHPAPTHAGRCCHQMCSLRSRRRRVQSGCGARRHCLDPWRCPQGTVHDDCEKREEMGVMGRVQTVNIVPKSRLCRVKWCDEAKLKARRPSSTCTGSSRFLYTVCVCDCACTCVCVCAFLSFAVVVHTCVGSRPPRCVWATIAFLEGAPARWPHDYKTRPVVMAMGVQPQRFA